MRRESSLAGLGALAFGILTFVAFMVANPPGGNYKASDVSKFLAKGHRFEVFLSAYLMLLAAAGLLLLLAHLRRAIGAGQRESVFWGFGVASVAAWLGGYAVAISPSLALAFSGGHLSTLPAPTAYTFSEAGWALMYGGGGLLLGAALVTFALGAVTVPAWVRWFTLVAGIASLAALAWFPFFLVYAWAIVLGIWTLVADRSRVGEPSAAPA